jgi:hypothetical protein
MFQQHEFEENKGVAEGATIPSQEIDEADTEQTKRWQELMMHATNEFRLEGVDILKAMEPDDDE